VRVQSGISGRRLLDYIEAVRREYVRRRPYDDLSGGLRQTNTIRLVAAEIFEDLSGEQKLAVICDAYALDSHEFLREDPREIFQASDTIANHLFDLVCEVAWQVLVSDIELRIEDEIRMALAES
jgi:hypothetical protein